MVFQTTSASVPPLTEPTLEWLQTIMRFDMCFQMAPVLELPRAFVALVRAVTRVHTHVTFQVTFLPKRLLTCLTLPRLLPAVDQLVSHEATALGERPGAQVALERPDASVNEFVFVQCAGLTEGLVANRALIWFHAFVNTAMYT